MDRWLHLICQELNYLIPPRSVRDHGRATDLIERNRHIDAAPFLWTFLIGTTQTDGSVSAVHDLYKAFTGDKVAYSSIQQWITPDLTHLLIDLIGYVSVEPDAGRRSQAARQPVVERREQLRLAIGDGDEGDAGHAVNRLGVTPRGFPWVSRTLPSDHRPDDYGRSGGSRSGRPRHPGRTPR